MTYLTMCQEVHNRLGMQGDFTSVSGGDSYMTRIAEMVSDAYRDLQTYRDDFYFLRTNVTLTVSAGVQTYVPYTSGASNNILTSGAFARFGHWDRDNVLYTNTNSDTIRLRPFHYDQWLTMNTSEAIPEPTKFSIDKSLNNLHFENLSVNKDVDIYYYKSPQILSANTDEPEFPLEHHQLIVWAGLKNASNFFGNGDAYQYAAIQYDKAIGAFHRTQIPVRQVRMIPLV